jgi:hypothetical protein
MRSIVAVLALSGCVTARASGAAAMTSRDGDRAAGGELAVTGGLGWPVPPLENTVYLAATAAATLHDGVGPDLAIAGSLEYANHRAVPARLGLRLAGHRLFDGAELAWGARLAVPIVQRRTERPWDPDDEVPGPTYEYLQTGVEVGVEVIPEVDDEVGGRLWILTVGLYRGFETSDRDH